MIPQRQTARPRDDGQGVHARIDDVAARMDEVAARMDEVAARRG